MAGKRISMADIADDATAVVPESRVPRFAAAASRTAPLPRVAPNPLNTRDITPERVAELIDSMRRVGQLQPCTVVTRDAFLTAFPEYGDVIGPASWVQVTGGRRRAAAELAGLASLDIVVKDDLAAERAMFLAATAAENLDRADYNPIEEARAIALLIKECGTATAAAAQVGRTKGWASQRIALLKLHPDVQRMVAAGDATLRDVRDLHQLPVGEQLDELLRRIGQASAKTEESTRVPTPRLSPAASAVRRLGGTPVEVADALVGVMKPDDVRQLVEALTAALREA